MIAEENPGSGTTALLPAEGGNAQPHLTGQLATFSPFELLQYLLFSGKAGRLELERSDGPQASCSLAGGSIAEATCGHLEGREAVLTFVWWREGRFRFIPGAARASRQVSGTIEALMMEAVRLADELEGLGSRVPPSAARLRLAGRAPAPNDDLDCGLDLIESALHARPHATRAELEASLSLCPVKVRLGLALLAAAGLLEETPPPRGAQVAEEAPPAAAVGRSGRGANDLRVLVVHTPQAHRSGLLDAVQDLGKAMGGPQARADLSPVGPSFVRFRPLDGNILSLTLLPISRRNRFLFETFVASVDTVLFCCGSDAGDEARAWKAVVPEGVRVASVDAPAALCDELTASLPGIAGAQP